ncbi:FmdE family protein [Methanobrevibacter sp. DSM 116169]|uniref:FmdE family protein n=1 Tax=Methanobrevibacter sp. DSM 116169 TaxID=3242727 RepID=UPI0038FC898D
MIKSFKQTADFHGHSCPGLAIGYKAAKIASEILNIGASDDEEIVTIVENDSCVVDAFQVVLSCTFGKGNLIFNDYGKGVYTVINRDTNQAVRLAMKKTFDPMKLNPDFIELKTKEKNQTITEDEKKSLKKVTEEFCNSIINAPDDEVFSIEKIDIDLPNKANVYESLVCDECDELTAEHRIKNYDGKKLCIPCFKKLNK